MIFFKIILVSLSFVISTVISYDLCTSNSSEPSNYTTFDVQNCGCDPNFCVRKCCKEGYFLGPKKVCIKNRTQNSKNEQTLFKVNVFRETKLLRTASNTSDFSVGLLQCRGFILNNSNPRDAYYVQENGYLWLPALKNFLNSSQYCVDEKDNLSVFICYPEVTKNDIIVINYIGMIVSMPFLLATFLVYALLPERNLHQNALMFYVMTLFLSYVQLVCVNMMDIDEAWCIILGYSTLFFFMVSFFWMNVICLDIWFTFSGSRGFVGSQRSSERRRLLIYALYAWGMPVLICFVVLLIQTYTDHNGIFNPKIGEKKCFLDGHLPEILYFYGEAGILIIINIVLFALTAHKIRQVKKQTKVLKQSDSQKHNNYEKDKRKFVLFVKLLMAMGINWSMEIISWAVIWASDGQYLKLWYVTDFCNAVYGVFIFFIFVFKKKVWQLLQKRYYTFMGKPHMARTVVSSTQQTNMSSGYSSADTHLTDRTDLRSSAGTNITNGIHMRPEEVALQRIRSA